jgi:1-acyl-sn-glycerol-3-phosphate acyltransferase
MFYKLAAFIARIVFFRHRTRSPFPLPQGGAIIAPNHTSFLDPLLISISLPEKVVFFARASLFKGPLGAILRSVNTYPIKRGKGDLGAIKQILAFLKEGKKVVLFPEGTRSPDGHLLPLQPGVALLAIKAQVPLIPIRIDGSFEAYPKHRKLPNPLKKTSCTLLKPLTSQSYPSQQALLNALEKALTPPC